MKNDKQILILWVENKPGVLMKISSLCRRRRFNIHSLTVGTSHLPDISHITLVLKEDESRLRNIVNQLNKLIEVIKVEIADSEGIVDKELVLIIVKNEKVAEKILKKKNLDLNVRAQKKQKSKKVLEVVGSGDEIEKLLKSLDMKKDVEKLVRSGLIAIKL